MAWSVEYFDHYSGYLSDDYSVPVQLAWGQFSVVELRIDGSVEVASIALSSISGVTQGAARGYICTSFADFVGADEVPTDYIATFGPDTTDSVEINVWMAGNPLYAVMVPWSMYTTGYVQFNFTVDGGGGGGNDPFYTAQGDDQNGAIDIWVSNYTDLSYDTFVYYIKQYGSDYLPPYETSAPYHTFGPLEDGDYTISVSYYYNGNEYYLPNQSGATITDITISGGGGGGGGDWQLYEERAGTVSSSFDFPYNNGFEGMTLYRMSITFSQNVTVTFSTSGSADTIGWLSEYNQTGWDDTTGRPTDYVASDDDSGSGSNFEFSYTCTAGNVYYLWYRTYGEGGFVGSTITLSVNLGAPAQQWSYDGVSGYSSLSSEVQKSISLSSMVGQYFGVSFRDAGTATISAPSGSNIDLFVTDANYSFDTSDGYPFDYGGGKASSSLSHNINVTAGMTYYVWVKGATSSTYGDVTITITPYSAPTGWEEVYVGDVNVTTTDRSFNRSCATMKTYRYNVRYSTAGTVRIYSTGATSSSDVIAYWGTSNNGINTSTGVPTSYSNVWDDDGSDRNFNSGEITVAANTTYYLWVRCYRDDTTAQITIYFTAPAADTGRVWIYTSSGWRKATPYIYNGSSWIKTTPYVYTSSGWKKCT